MMHWSEEYVGIPWKTGSRDISEGLDCWGLLRYFYQKHFDITLSEHPVPTGYIAKGEHVVSEELATGEWHEVLEGKLQDGDAVVYGKGKDFSHVCIYVDLPVPSVIHTARKALSTIVSLKEMKARGWDNVKAYRHA